ncbi:lysophospholipid acyltransferase family protein [Kribbia dieselivorans]|uniref:lysophospholipid acyltransferase family protein n=1 Tax=Kribbia dieselivorans TaxID=331526 RepID=UPI001FE1234C|nr:lysophospholipid acyltransferase family protein [Kribbia dieselivorans]
MSQPAAPSLPEPMPRTENFLRRIVVGPAFSAFTRLTVEGHEHVPATGPAMIASNHQSYLDSIVIPIAARRPVRFIAKAEYFTGTGVMGAINRLWFGGMGAIPVDRADPRAAVRSLELAEEVLRAGGAFGIYPEGTRSRDGRLHRGRTGIARIAIATGAPIIPCAITGTADVQGPDEKGIHRAKVTVRFGPAIDVASLQAQFTKAKLLRAITDATMDAIGDMSPQERSGRYASDVNAEIAAREAGETLGDA